MRKTGAFAVAVMATASLVSGCTGSSSTEGSGSTTGPSLSPPVSSAPTSAPVTSPTVPSGLNTSPPDEASGSAIEAIVPCASGTSSLKASRAGGGVRMDEVLRGTGFGEWDGLTFVTPQFDHGATRTPTYTADADGVVRITADNRDNKAPHATRAWPQLVAVEDLSPTSDYTGINCSGQVYLGSYVATFMPNLTTRFRADGTSVRVRSTSGSSLSADGVWRVSVTVSSPQGEETRSDTQQARIFNRGYRGYGFSSKLGPFRDLRNVRTIEIRASNEEHDITTSETIIRTP